MRTRTWLTAVAVAVAVVLGACGDEGKLGNELSERYGNAVVGRDSASQAVVVLFPASPFAERPDSARRATARKVAEYVRDHYPRYKGVKKVTVQFATRKEIESSKDHVAATYSFTPDQLDDGGS